MLKDYTLILAYKLLMTHLGCSTTLLPVDFVPLEHAPWGCLTAGTCRTMERLEDAELVAAPP